MSKLRANPALEEARFLRLLCDSPCHFEHRISFPFRQLDVSLVCFSPFVLDVSLDVVRFAVPCS